MGPADGDQEGGPSDLTGLRTRVGPVVPGPGIRRPPPPMTGRDDVRPGEPGPFGRNGQRGAGPTLCRSRIERGLAIDDIAAYLNETSLFRNQWGYRPHEARRTRSSRPGSAPSCGSGWPMPAPPTCCTRLSPMAIRRQQRRRRPGVWKDESRTAEWLRFTFPRQPAEPWLSVPTSSGRRRPAQEDWAAFHLVTMGAAVSEETARLFAANRYDDYLHLHGIGDRDGEACELWHRRIREEWASPTRTAHPHRVVPPASTAWALLVGLPGLPRPEDNAKCAELVNADRIGVEGARSRRGSSIRADHRRHHLPPPAGQVLRVRRVDRARATRTAMAADGPQVISSTMRGGRGADGGGAIS